VPKSELNGLGSKGLGWMVRDRWGGVDFSRAGNVHDGHYWCIKKFRPHVLHHRLLNQIYMDVRKFYLALGSRNELQYANKVFYQNLNIINNHESKTVVGKYMRKPILFLYYMGVKIFGRVEACPNKFKLTVEKWED